MIPGSRFEKEEKYSLESVFGCLCMRNSLLSSRTIRFGLECVVMVRGPKKVATFNGLGHLVTSTLRKGSAG